MCCNKQRLKLVGLGIISRILATVGKVLHRALDRLHTIRKLPYKEFIIFNLKLKDHQLQVKSFIKSNFP